MSEGVYDSRLEDTSDTGFAFLNEYSQNHLYDVSYFNT